MKTKLHTLFIYPLVLIFSTFLKGKKNEYKNFFMKKQDTTIKNNILQIKTKNSEFYEKIHRFFDKKSPIYDKTFIEFEIETTKPPEEKKYFTFDFERILKIFYTLSMLSAKLPNENINIGLSLKKQKLDDKEINHFLRYALLAFASKRVDNIYFDIESLKNDKIKLAFETMVSYINNSTIVNFSNAKNLYVITCKQGKKTFDIIWSSSSDIELTDFGKVYDKYGAAIKENITISSSPIYAFHT